MLKIIDLKQNDILKGPITNGGWCRTGIYRVYIREDNIILSDTYWNDISYEYGAKKVKEDSDLEGFEFIVNEDDIQLIAYDFIDMYDKKNIFYLPLRKGGTSERHYYVLKNAKRNSNLEIQHYRNQIKSNERRMDYLLKENQELEEKISKLEEKVEE